MHALTAGTATRVAMLQAVAKAEALRRGCLTHDTVKAATLLVLDLAQQAYLGIRHPHQAYAFVMVACGRKASTRLM